MTPTSTSETLEWLGSLGLGATQLRAIEPVLRRNAPALVVRTAADLSRDQRSLSSLIVAPGVYPTSFAVRRALTPTGVAILVGSEDARLDRCKLGLHEHGHLGAEAPGGHEVWWGGPSPPADTGETRAPLPLIVSYFTTGTAYEDEARRLIASCEATGVPHDVRGIRPFGSWEANCAFKATFVRERWLEANRPVMWVDADAVIHRPPDLLRGATCDFAVHKFDRWELASGSVYFGATEAAGILLERWERLCRRYPHIWDQVLLAAAWEDAMRAVPLATWWLPPAYTLVFDRPEVRIDAVEPVIMHHQASRRLKTAVSGASQPRPEPPVPETWRRARRASRAWLDRAGRPLAIKTITDPDYVSLPGTPAVVPPEFPRFERRIVRWLKRHASPGLRIGVFGASWFGARIIARIRAADCEPVAVFDNAVERHGSSFAGIPVRLPDASLGDLDAVVIASIGHGRAIEAQIRSSAKRPVLLSAHRRFKGC